MAETDQKAVVVTGRSAEGVGHRLAEAAAEVASALRSGLGVAAAVDAVARVGEALGVVKSVVESVLLCFQSPAVAGNAMSVPGGDGHSQGAEGQDESRIDHRITS